MTGRTLWAWARPLGGAAILAVVVWRLGTGPVLAGIRTIDGWSLVAAAGIAVLTTTCCAWRWTLVARGLGLELPLRVAVPAYYRSQFLNSTLPGGVLGDVDRALQHGRDVGDLGRGMRAVAWERVAGQVVQVSLAIIVLLALPSPVHSSLPVVGTAVVLGAVGVIVVIQVLPRDGASRWAWALGTAVADIRDGLLARRAWPGIVIASAVAVIGHTATFLLAAHSAGSTVSPARMLPLALLVILATTIPTNIAGWGPREGMAAWAFGAAGLSADQGVTTAVVYGVMVFVASLPGAGVLVRDWLQRRARRPKLVDAPPLRERVTATTEGAARG
jgi:uncharacterized membrane protein YbhN (UPF0104 family)